jgi:hypothetical protein
MAADLDKAERTAQQFSPDGWVRSTVFALVAELRAARAFEEHIRAWVANDPAAHVGEVVGVYDDRVRQLNQPS